MATIRNPIEWSLDRAGAASGYVAGVRRAVRGSAAGQPQVRRIGRGALRQAIARGFDDFMACRTDVAAICIVYPLAGLVLAWLFFDYRMLPLVFPAASGLALVGPALAVGLCEISRRRERGEQAGASSMLAVPASPSFGAILLLGLALFVLLGLWLVTAWGIWSATLGPVPADTPGEFARQVVFTGPGWVMAVAGCAVGALFALVVLATTVVTFPLLLDRDCGLGVAVTTSVRVAAENPGTVLAWGGIVAAGLVIGSIPAFLGLIVVMPVLGHATWHLYRAAVVPPD